MPHAELKYSADLSIDAAAVLENIETVINDHDAGAGPCKGRAYPASVFHHTHLLVEISMLTKPHRDAAFTKDLITDLENHIKAMVQQSCYFSLELKYSGDTYVTNRFEP